MGFLNVSTTPCSLSGFPTAYATSAGAVVGAVGKGTLSPDPPPPRDLVPGDFAVAALESSSACRRSGEPDHRTDRIIFQFEDGDLGVDLAMSTACYLGVTRFGSRPDPETHAPYEQLAVRLILPESVRAGNDLRFVVAVDNPTSSPVSLARCPAWRYEAVQNGTPLVPTLDTQREFDCDAVSAIPAHGTVRYEMRTPLPGSRAGKLSIGWYFAPLGAGQIGELLVR